MYYYVNGNRVQEHCFWNEVQGLASEQQIKRLLDGKKLMIGGRTYEIVEETK